MSIPNLPAGQQSYPLGPSGGMTSGWLLVSGGPIGPTSPGSGYVMIGSGASVWPASGLASLYSGNSYEAPLQVASGFYFRAGSGFGWLPAQKGPIFYASGSFSGGPVQLLPVPGASGFGDIVLSGTGLPLLSGWGILVPIPPLPPPLPMAPYLASGMVMVSGPYMGPTAASSGFLMLGSGGVMTNSGNTSVGPQPLQVASGFALQLADFGLPGLPPLRNVPFQPPPNWLFWPLSGVLGSGVAYAAPGFGFWSGFPLPSGTIQMPPIVCSGVDMSSSLASGQSIVAGFVPPGLNPQGLSVVLGSGIPFFFLASGWELVSGGPFGPTINGAGQCSLSGVFLIGSGATLIQPSGGLTQGPIMPGSGFGFRDPFHDGGVLIPPQNWIFYNSSGATSGQSITFPSGFTGPFQSGVFGTTTFISGQALGAQQQFFPPFIPSGVAI